MRLSSRQDVAAAADQVFGLLADFPVWERAALRRGAEVTRDDLVSAPGPGMEWRVRFDWRGRRRDAVLRLERMEAPSHLAFSFVSVLFEGTVTVDIFEMAARRSRIHVIAEVKPRTLASRLMLQSLRLTRNKVERRFDSRIGDLAANVESRLKGRHA
ncbi:MAG: SRPBCC family protein [Paracoccaceae bacterium]